MSNNINFADMSAASMLCTAIGNGCYAAACFGLVPVNPIFGGWILTAYLVQMFVVISDMRRGNLVGANLTLIFSSFMFLAGSLKIIFSYTTESWGWKYNVTPSAIGTLLVCGILILLLPLILRMPLCTAIMFLCLIVVFAISGFMDFGLLPTKECTIMNGIFLSVATVVPMYSGCAQLVNAGAGRVIYPLPDAVIK